MTPQAITPADVDVLPSKASKFGGPEGAVVAAAVHTSEGIASRSGSKQILEQAESVDRKKRLNPLTEQPALKRTASKLSTKLDPQSSKLSTKLDPQSSKPQHVVHTNEGFPLRSKSSLTESSDGVPEADATAATPANRMSSFKSMPSDQGKEIKGSEDVIQCDQDKLLFAPPHRPNSLSPAKGKRTSASQDMAEGVARASDAGSTRPRGGGATEGDEPEEGMEVDDGRVGDKHLHSGLKNLHQSKGSFEHGRAADDLLIPAAKSVDSSGRGEVHGEVSDRSQPDVAREDKKGKRQMLDGSDKEPQFVKKQRLDSSDKKSQSVRKATGSELMLDMKSAHDVKTSMASAKEKQGSKGQASQHLGPGASTAPVVAARSSHADEREVIMVECLVDANGRYKASRTDGAVSTSITTSRVTEQVDMGKLKHFVWPLQSG
jgi:hypothetical protein